MLGICLELARGHHVRRQQELHAKLLGLGEDGRGGLKHVFLHERGADVEALGLQEGEGEAAAEHEDVNLLHQRRDDGELAGHLGASDDGGQGSFGLIEAKEGQLLLHELAHHALVRPEHGWHAHRGRVRSVRRAKGVVDVEVRDGRQLSSELRFVLLLRCVEAQVLQEADGARGHACHGLGHRIPNAVVHVDHRGVGQQLSESRGHGRHDHVRLALAFGSAQVRHEHHLGALLQQRFDGGERLAHARVIRDARGVLLVQRHIEVHAHETHFALDVVGLHEAREVELSTSAGRHLWQSFEV
mmetsp:Transcript_11276/g.42088  ORF Transcript_11276/g.42088 Transcript_11276/m.42088 type:complete len:300 (+) Transcript_11276:515-1414(+)